MLYALFDTVHSCVVFSVFSMGTRFDAVKPPVVHLQ
jgi:hypothetical protein